MQPPLEKLVHFYRKRSGLTQQKLADIAGVGKSVIYDLEKGKKTIQLDTLSKILHVLNIKIIFKPPFEFEEINNEKS